MRDKVMTFMIEMTWMVGWSVGIWQWCDWVPISLGILLAATASERKGWVRGRKGQRDFHCLL